MNFLLVGPAFSRPIQLFLDNEELAGHVHLTTRDPAIEQSVTRIRTLLSTEDADAALAEVATQCGDQSDHGKVLFPGEGQCVPYMVVMRPSSSAQPHPAASPCAVMPDDRVMLSGMLHDMGNNVPDSVLGSVDAFDAFDDACENVDTAPADGECSDVGSGLDSWSSSGSSDSSSSDSSASDWEVFSGTCSSSCSSSTDSDTAIGSLLADDIERIDSLPDDNVSAAWIRDPAVGHNSLLLGVPLPHEGHRRAVAITDVRVSVPTDTVMRSDAAEFFRAFRIEHHVRASLQADYLYGQLIGAGIPGVGVVFKVAGTAAKTAVRVVGSAARAGATAALRGSVRGLSAGARGASRAGTLAMRGFGRAGRGMSRSLSRGASRVTKLPRMTKFRGRTIRLNPSRMLRSSRIGLRRGAGKRRSGRRRSRSRSSRRGGSRGTRRSRVQRSARGRRTSTRRSTGRRTSRRTSQRSGRKSARQRRQQRQQRTKRRDARDRAAGRTRTQRKQRRRDERKRRRERDQKRREGRKQSREDRSKQRKERREERKKRESEVEKRQKDRATERQRRKEEREKKKKEEKPKDEKKKDEKKDEKKKDEKDKEKKDEKKDEKKKDEKDKEKKDEKKDEKDKEKKDEKKDEKDKEKKDEKDKEKKDEKPEKETAKDRLKKKAKEKLKEKLKKESEKEPVDKKALLEKAKEKAKGAKEMKPEGGEGGAPGAGGAPQGGAPEGGEGGAPEGGAPGAGGEGGAGEGHGAMPATAGALPLEPESFPLTGPYAADDADLNRAAREDNAILRRIRAAELADRQAELRDQAQARADRQAEMRDKQEAEEDTLEDAEDAEELEALEAEDDSLDVVGAPDTERKPFARELELLLRDHNLVPKSMLPVADDGAGFDAPGEGDFGDDGGDNGPDPGESGVFISSRDARRLLAQSLTSKHTHSIGRRGGVSLVGTSAPVPYVSVRACMDEDAGDMDPEHPFFPYLSPHHVRSNLPESMYLHYMRRCGGDESAPTYRPEASGLAPLHVARAVACALDAADDYSLPEDIQHSRVFAYVSSAPQMQHIICDAIGGREILPEEAYTAVCSALGISGTQINPKDVATIAVRINRNVNIPSHGTTMMMRRILSVW